MRDPHLDAEAPVKHTAAAIVGTIDMLLAMRDNGAQVDEDVKAAVEMLFTTECLSYEDALAFISISHRIMTGPDENARTADNNTLFWGGRFLERAYEFLHADGRARGKLAEPHFSTLH